MLVGDKHGTLFSCERIKSEPGFLFFTLNQRPQLFHQFTDAFARNR
jgi:hypothetical protein